METLDDARDIVGDTRTKGMEGYQTVEAWLNNVKPTTAKPYLHFLRRFCEYTKTDPDRLVEQAKADSEIVHNTLKAYRRTLETQGLASYTLQLAYNAVRSFLTWNNVKMSKSPRAFKGRTRYESDRILEPHEVARMISFAQSTRDKALISMLCHGQRVGVLPALRYRMIREQLEKGFNPIVVSVKAELIDERGLNVNKASVAYRFGISRETADLLRQMIQERREAGEPMNDDSWLFRSYSEKFEGRLQRISRTAPGHAITRDSIWMIVVEAAKKAGVQVKRTIGTAINGKTKVKFEVHPHVFRRFWKHQMRAAGVTDADLLDFMLGHELPFSGAYDRYTADDIRKAYTQAEPKLTVMVSPEISEQIELTELEEKHAPVLAALPEATRVKYASKSPREKVVFLKTIPAQRVTAKPEKKVMVIDESEAENHLNHGYEFVTVLPSGKLLVRLRE